MISLFFVLWFDADFPGYERTRSRLIKIKPIPTIYTFTSIPFFLHSHHLPALQERLAREEDGRFFPRMSRRGVWAGARITLTTMVVSSRRLHRG